MKNDDKIVIEKDNDTILWGGRLFKAEQAEQAEQAGKVWKPKRNEWYWAIGVEGTINTHLWRDTYHHEAEYERGNCYRTEKQAMQALKKQILLTKMRRAAIESGEIDWGGGVQAKWGAHYLHKTKKWDVLVVHLEQDINQIYFATEEALQAFLDEHKNELHLLLENNDDG